ncbi:MAG: PKD domain-containing protein [Saprospiraceae bacterium]
MHLLQPKHFIWYCLCLLPFFTFKMYGQGCTGTQRVDASYELEQNDVCEGIEIVVRNTSQEFGNDNTFYIWDWGDGTRDTTFDLSSVRHTYRFTDQNVCEDGLKISELRLDARVPGCTQFNHFVIKPVYIFLKPIAQFETKPMLCTPDITAMFKNTSCTADTGTTYAWNFGDPASGAADTSSLFEPTHTFSGPGMYIVTLDVKSKCGTGSFSSIIEVKAPPVALAEADIPSGAGCVPVIVNLRNRSTGATMFSWKITPADGATFVDSTNNMSQAPRILFSKAGDYTITLTAENECGNTTWEQKVKISEPPSVTWEDPQIACERLDYTPKITYGGTISSYSWVFDGGNPRTSTEPNPMNIAYDIPGTYVATLTVTGACGAQTFVKTIEIIPKASISFTPVEPICNTADPIQLSANLLGGTWTGPGVNAQGIFNPATANVGANSIQYTYGPANCRSEGSFSITVLPATPVMVGNDITICNNQPDITLDFTPRGGAWRGNGIVDSLQGIFSPQQAGAGAQILTYRYVEPSNGCVTTARKTIQVAPVPTVNIAEATVSFCLFNGNIILPDELNVQVSPTGGTNNWTGTGITNAAQGIFNNNNLNLGTYPILYTYTSPAGCVASDSLIIQVIPKPQATAQMDTTVCISIGNLTLQAAPIGGQWSGSQINTNSGLINLTQAGGGRKIYTYTIFAGTTCEAKDEVTVDIIDLSGVSAGADVGYCESEAQITLAGFSPGGGSWSGVGVVDSIRGVVDIQALSPGNYTLTYQIKSQAAAACAAEDQLVLTVHPLPQAGFTTESRQCIGDSIAFTNTSVNATSFNWNFGNGQNSTLENPKVTYATAGDYNLSLTVQSQFGCTKDTTVLLHVSEPPPMVAFDMDQRSGCADLTVQFNNRSQGEDVSFTWNFGNGRTDSIAIPMPVTFVGTLEDTIYYVQLAARNICGERTFRDSVQVLARPTANFGTRLSRYCSGDAVEIRNASAGKPTAYFWDFGNGLTSRDSIPPTQYYFINNEPDTFKITLVARNNCAADTTSLLIPINPTNVKAFFNIDATEVCVGDTIRLRNFSTPGASITYQFGDNNTSATPNAQHVYSEPGRYKIIQYARSCGFDSTFAFVDVRPTPTVLLNLEPFACQNADVNFKYTASEIVGTFWDFGNGSTSTLPNPSNRYDSVGVYTVRLTATDANQCAATIEQKIEVTPLPVFTIRLPDSLCIRETGIFEVIPTSTNLSSYNWQYGDQEQGSGRATQYKYSESGIYTVAATVTDNNGCKNTESRRIFVRPGPEAAFKVNYLNGCAPTGVAFVNESKSANSYRWEFGDGNTSEITNPSNSYGVGGEYIAKLIAAYDNICFDTISQKVTINPIPQASIQAEDLTCHGKNDGRILVTPNGNHLITVTGKDYFQQGGNLFEALKPGQYDIEVLATTGCDTIYTVEIGEPDTLFAYIQPDTIRVVVGDTATIQVIANNANLNYKWLPDSELTPINVNTFFTSTQRSLWYNLVATVGRCELRDSVFVEVDTERKVYIPNAFSPNGDNVNEYFYIHGGDGIVEIERFIIFERRGGTVFDQSNIQPNDPTVGWDGTLKGKKMNPAVFVYYAEIKFIDGKTEIFSGDVTLVR